MRAVWLFAAVTFALGCGGLRVGDVTHDRPRTLARFDVPEPHEIRLAPVSDATVNSDPAWRSEALGEEEWLLVASAPGRAAHWMTYLSFDLAVLPPGTRFSAAMLELPYGVEDVPPVDVYRVLTPWSEADISWDRQPRVSHSPAARISSAAPGCQFACADLTRVINSEIDAGGASISLLLVPVEPWAPSSVRWPSMESFGEDAIAGEVPVLRMSRGERPPPPSAAVLDRERGIN